MRSEQFAFHDFGKAKNGVERRAQFMAHRGEEAGFGEICRLGAAAGQIAVCLGLFELGDQLVLFGLKRQRFERSPVQLPGNEHEIELRTARQRNQRQGSIGKARWTQETKRCDGHRRQGAGHRGRNRGGDRRVHCGNEQKQDEGIAARGGVAGLADEPNDRRPCDSLEHFGEDEFAAPAAGVEHGFFGVQELAGNPVSHTERRKIEGEPNQDCVYGDPCGGGGGGHRRLARPWRGPTIYVLSRKGEAIRRRSHIGTMRTTSASRALRVARRPGVRAAWRRPDRQRIRPQ